LPLESIERDSGLDSEICLSYPGPGRDCPACKSWAAPRREFSAVPGRPFFQREKPDHRSRWPANRHNSQL